MKFRHTVQIALALNARVIDNDGAPVAAYVGRVVYLFCWLPGWLLDLRFWIYDLRLKISQSSIVNRQSTIENWLSFRAVGY